MLGKIKIGDIEFSRSGDLEIKCVVHEATRFESERVPHSTTKGEGRDRFRMERMPGRKWTSYGQDPAEAFANALRCVADVLV